MEFSREKLVWHFKQKTPYFINKLKQIKIQLSCCDLCNGSCQSQPILCDFCSDDLPRFELEALHGDLLMWPAIAALLPNRKFDRLVSVAPYQWPIDLWIRQLKYHGRFELVEILGILLFQQWQNNRHQKNQENESLSLPSLLLSVPIHLKKWQKRGFNQAHLLADNFAKKAQITYLPNALIRVDNNRSQAGQTGITRRKNLRNAFELSPDWLLKYNNKKCSIPEHVLLLDDVVTTGSTCNEICRLLKRNGVKQVSVLSLCLSLPNSQIITQ